MTESDPGQASGFRRARRLAGPALVVLALVWVAAGVTRVPADRFGVLERPAWLGGDRLVESGRAIAVPGLSRLVTYPRPGTEIALPQAERAQLPAADGSRFGFRGWVTLRAEPSAWRELHQAARDDGMDGALLEAVRAAVARMAIDPSRNGLNPALSREFEQRLGEELASRGLDLRRCELDAIDYLAATGEGSPGHTDTRLLVVGLDGADWAIVDPLLEQGRLPNLARLVREGARAKLRTISPMLSPVIWTSIATGVEPNRHGILDFLVQDAKGGQRQPVTAAQRKVPAVWEMLSRSGVDVGVVGWWASWPADPVRGYLVSDRLAYQLFGFRADPSDSRGKTWPPDLYESLRPRIVAPADVPWSKVLPFVAGPRRELAQFDPEEQQLLEEFRTLLASGETYVDIGVELRRRFDPRLELIYLEGTDTVGHLFMPYRLPQLPGLSDTKVASFSEMVDRYYEEADRQLGRLLEDRGANWTVMVLSDHGFASDATRPRTSDSRIGHGGAASWHRRFGLLVLSGAHVRAGVELSEAEIYDIAPTILALFDQPIPRSWPGRVLAEAIDPAFLERHPVRYRLQDPLRRDGAGSAMADPAAADLLAKLESLGYVSSAGAQAGDSATAQNNAAVSLLGEGRFEQAEQVLREALEQHPDAAMLRVNLGLTLRLLGRRDEALRLFESVLDQPGSRRAAGTHVAQLRLENGQGDAAERLVRELIEEEPGAAELHNTLGLILEAREDLDAAERSYERAAELDPDVASARNNLGTLARRRNDLDRAENWYLRAIEADPYFMASYNNLALVYQARGRMQQAIDLYATAMAKSPDNAVVQNNLASLYYATGDVPAARELWERCVEISPEYPSPLNNLAGVAIGEGHLERAESLLERALALDPEYGDARINRAILLDARGRTADARAELTRATTDRRTGPNSWLQLGLFELQHGRAAAALHALEQADRREPGRPRILNPLGQALLVNGRTADARRIWERSLAIDPGQAEVRALLDGLP